MRGDRDADPGSDRDRSEPTDRPSRSPPESDSADLLAHPRRRRVLERLRARGGRAGIAELAEELAAIERETVDDEGAKLVRLDLLHAHLPKLAEADVLEYDPETGVVELVDDARRRNGAPGGHEDG